MKVIYSLIVYYLFFNAAVLTFDEAEVVDIFDCEVEVILIRFGS